MKNEPKSEGHNDQAVEAPDQGGKRRWSLVWQIALIGILFVGIRAFTQNGLVQGQAPEFSGLTLQGPAFSLQQALKANQGRPMLIHFWASWCSICRVTEGSIEAIAKDYPVITIAMQSGDHEEVAAYLRKQGLSFPVILDEEGELSARYGVKGVPTDLIVDSQGQVRFSESGYSSEWGLRARLWYLSP